jgi:YjbE family integral membrane protein
VPDLDFLSRLLQIILFDLILSGDNAVVIGMAARRLPPRSRRRAVVFGGVGAVVLRVLFTGVAALVLDPERGLPVIMAVGGVLLLWVSYRLLRPQEHGVHVTEAESLAQAIRTIVLADVVMSLDNILAIGVAAHGNLSLLLFGLALSIPILLVGSNLVARLLGRLPILVYLGAVILIWTSVHMILDDELIHEVYEATFWQTAAVSAVAAVAIILLARRAGRREPAVDGESPAPGADERQPRPPQGTPTGLRGPAKSVDG